MECPRSTVLLIFSALVLLFFTQAINIEVFHNVKNNKEIQELGQFVVDKINETTKESLERSGLPVTDEHIWIFHKVIVAKRWWNTRHTSSFPDGSYMYFLKIKLQSRSGKRQKLSANLRIRATN
ncbi:hypothetical protein M5K25_026036 [Dendrobium thyrsiflorum]|uniref:Uncharacterized protein n=1 Tax=Dendrobium thyrsiflorum TaxID=117978 RepID=A0ABD0TWG9_DENTH